MMNQSLTSKLLGPIRTRNILSVLIWTLGIIGMAAWTIKDLIPLFEEYLHRNVDSHMEVIRNDSAWPPNLTVCIPHYSDSLGKIARCLSNGSLADPCEECDALTMNGWDVWADSNFPMTKASLINALLRRIINESSNGLEFLRLNRTNFNWNQPLIEAVWNFFGDALRSDFPFLLSRIPPPGESARITDEIIRRGIVDELYEYAVKAIHLYYQRSVIADVDSLYKTNATQSSVDALTFVPRAFCQQVWHEPLGEIHQFTPIDGNVSGGDHFEPPWIRAPNVDEFSIWIDENILYGAWSGPDALYKTAQSDLRQRNYEQVVVDFNVDMKVIETRPRIECVRNESILRCALRSMLEELSSKCDCMPLGYRNLFPDMVGRVLFCSPLIYEQCSQNVERTLMDYRDTCSNQCEFIARKGKCAASTWHDPSSKLLTFQVTYEHVLFSPYVQVSITDKLSLEGFISQLGGVIGLFLGFSGLSLCALVVFCVEDLQSKILNDRVRTISLPSNQKQVQPSELEGIGSSVSKRILLADIARMIQAEGRVVQEKVIDVMREEMESLRKENGAMKQEISDLRNGK